MTRPNTLHKGFFVPNGSGVADPVMAEPDQIDYNIAGNDQWGVVTGCEVTVSAGTTAEITTGIAIVNGVVVPVTGGQTVALGSGSSQPRFDLIGVDPAGMLTVLAGSPAADPLFPDPSTGFTVLAAVLAPAGATSFSDYVVDKRHMLQTVLVGTGTGDTTLLLNRTSGIDTFRITADGHIYWNNAGASIDASGATITVHNHLVTTGDLTVDGYLSLLHDLYVTGNITSDNFQRSGSFPATAANGTILVNNGLTYVRRAGLWEQLLTTGTGGDQVGDIKQTMRTPDQMPGWLQMNGQSVAEADRPLLFAVGGLAGFITGVAPNRTLTLPDATDRFLLSSNTPGQTGGASTFNIATANLPPHVHGVAMTAAGNHVHAMVNAPAGQHRHLTVQFDPYFTSGYDGKHTHPVIDPGHIHTGADGWAGVSNWPFVALAWGGRNMLDGPINDASHTYAVEPMQSTVPARTGVTVGYEGSQHQHLTEYADDHVHASSMSTDGSHVHPLTEQSVGSGQAISYRPKYLTIYTYIKV